MWQPHQPDLLAATSAATSPKDQRAKRAPACQSLHSAAPLVIDMSRHPEVEGDAVVLAVGVLYLKQ
ncbi:hypothetical protein PF003_g3232 [Phytophthora fragariae]|nr:hypothetical protein PF003_g3232 [Phytophthora fragariae]